MGVVVKSKESPIVIVVKSQEPSVDIVLRWQGLSADIVVIIIIIIIMYIYHALINALSAHMIHINLNMILYTHVKHSPTKTVYIKYYLKNK